MRRENLCQRGLEREIVTSEPSLEAQLDKETGWATAALLKLEDAYESAGDLFKCSI